MQTKISKYSVKYFNEKEFHTLKREIFTNNCYYFPTENRNPLIIDVGAYIGISILYFKHIYPNCKIIAFEPNPTAFKKLEENIFENDIKNVELHNTGISYKTNKKEMYIDDSNMNRYSVASFRKNGWNREVESKKIEVKTEKLDKYMDRPIELLKLDVEGSEWDILSNISSHFTNIRNIIFEYHPIENQNIEKFINLLKKQYDIKIFKDGKEIGYRIPNNELLTIKAIYKD
jgi:FkbM family methyltransferase